MLRTLTADNRQAIEKLIFEEAVKRAGDRITFDQSRLLKFGVECCKLLSSGGRNSEDKKLLSWLQRLLKFKSKNWQELSLACHQARPKQLVEIRTGAKEGRDPFDELAYYIGRLGAHRYVVLVIVSAWLRVTSLRKIQIVCLVAPAEVRKIELAVDRLNPYNIVIDICKALEVNLRARILHAFIDVDEVFVLQARMMNRRSIINRVHAELLIVAEFGQHQHKFVDDDKYIGCSKGACYFCCIWIVLHYERLRAPASHNKVILGCRGLDRDLDDNGIKLYVGMFEKMIKAVEQDIERHLETYSAKTTRHYCSTDGTSWALSTGAS